MSRNNAVEFAAGFGQGYLNTEQRQKEEARRDRLEAEQKARQDKQDARQAAMDQRSLEASDLQLGEARAGRDLRLSLADAARPREAVAGAGGMIRPETMDNRDVGLPENQTMPNQGLSLGAARVGNQIFATQPEADKFAQAQNRPDAVMGRQSLAYAQAGRPDQASAMDKQRREYAQWLQNEGVVAAAQAARRGDPKAVFEAFNRQGENKLKDLPQVTEEIRDIPGYGKLKTFTYTGTVVGPDGKEQPITRNSHDMLMELMPYKDILDMGLKGQENVSKQEDRVAKASVAEQKAQSAQALAEAKIAVLEAKKAAGSGAGVSREERLRYTSLFNEAGRRMQDTQRAVNTLMRDPIYSMAKPGSPQHTELQELRGSMNDYRAERDQWGSLLSGSQTSGNAPSLADPKKNPTAKPNPAKISSDYSNLWK